MKKILFFLLFLPVLTNAQYISIGLKTGITSSQLIGDEYKGYHKIGFSGGLFSQISLNKSFKLRLEVLHTMKGCQYKLKDYKLLNPYPYFVQLQYLEFPLLLRYQYKKLILELGPGIGYLIEQKEFIPGRNLNDPINRFEKTEKSIHTGIGVYFNKQWGCIIRYSNSIVPIRREPTVQLNSVFTFSIFFQYDFKKERE